MKISEQARQTSGQQVSDTGSLEGGAPDIYADMQLIDLNAHSPRHCIRLTGNDQNIMKLLVIHNQTWFKVSPNYRITLNICLKTLETLQLNSIARSSKVNLTKGNVERREVYVAVERRKAGELMKVGNHVMGSTA